MEELNRITKLAGAEEGLTGTKNHLKIRQNKINN